MEDSKKIGFFIIKFGYCAVITTILLNFVTFNVNHNHNFTNKIIEHKMKIEISNPYTNDFTIKTNG